MREFEKSFGRPAEIVTSAPGRVNLIGEHTDYNGGFVLPAVIPQRTTVALRRRDDDRVRLWSGAFAADGTCEYRLGEETRRGSWIDYVQGCTRALGSRLPCGLDASVSSEVPVGAGLASSAALEIAFLRGVREAFGLPLDDLELALVAHGAESEFVGARVGLMDQIASSLGDDATALFLDARTLAHERIPIPESAELLVIDSGVSHHHATGGYNTRRDECERACALLGVRELRDLDPGGAASLPSPLDRRVRHVVGENERVLGAVAALRERDLVRLGELFYASHASMRDDYEVSIAEIDLLVEIARSYGDVFGARLTGGGFGGSIVALVRAGRGRVVARRMASEYARRGGRRASVLVSGPRFAGGSADRP
jgi:galactokinase